VHPPCSPELSHVSVNQSCFVFVMVCYYCVYKPKYCMKTPQKRDEGSQKIKEKKATRGVSEREREMRECVRVGEREKRKESGDPVPCAEKRK